MFSELAGIIDIPGVSNVVVRSLHQRRQKSSRLIKQFMHAKESENVTLNCQENNKLRELLQLISVTLFLVDCLQVILA